MSLRDRTDAYGSVSVVNHWLLAVVVVALLASGVLAAEILGEEQRRAILAPHKAVGVLVLAVVAWMLVWRLLQPSRPGAVPGTPTWEAVIRKAMHLFLIAGTVILSGSGIVMAVFKGRPVDVFGLFAIPGQAEVPWLADAAHEVHFLGGWILIAAVLGHAAVALKHHLVDHDATFMRMLGRAS